MELLDDVLTSDHLVTTHCLNGAAEEFKVPLPGIEFDLNLTKNLP